VASLSEEKRILEKIEEEESYFNSHYEDFLERYEGLILAIKDRKVIEAEETIEKLLEKLEKKGVNIYETFITSLPKKSIAFIL